MPDAARPVMGAAVTVKVDGTPVNATLNTYLKEFVFEDSVHVPDLLELQYADPGRAFPTGTDFAIGKELEVTLNAPGSEPAVFKAEITGLSARYVSGVYTMTVRGLDQMHRLHRGRWTKTYEQALASTVFESIVSDHELTAGTVDATEVEYPYLSIVNESHYSFLRRLAADNGRVLSFADGKINFTQREAPATVVSLSPNAGLMDLEIALTTADMTDRVTVRGWDPQNKEMVENQTGVTATTIKLTNGSVDEIAANFQASDGATVIASPTYATTAEVEAVAEGLAEYVGGSFAEIHAMSPGLPTLRAGSSIELVDVPDQFLGEFVVSTTRHVVSAREGYTTEFTVSADHDRSLLALSSGGSGPSGPVGVVPAVVTDNDDPEKLGRVRVRFPWAADDHESHWARTMVIGAGPERGITFLPSIDDEVLVAFLDGSAAYPVVLGGLHNGVDAFPDGDPKVSDKQPRIRGLYTDKQAIVFDDTDGSEFIQIGMRDGTYAIHVDSGNTMVHVQSDGTVEINAKEDVTVTTDKNMSVTTTQDLSFTAQGAVSISGGTGVEITQGGASVKLEGSVTISGPSVAIN